MTRAIVTLILTMCAVAVVVEVHNRPQNAGLPIVKTSAPICAKPALHWQFKQRRIA